MNGDNCVINEFMQQAQVFSSFLKASQYRCNEICRTSDGLYANLMQSFQSEKHRLHLISLLESTPSPMHAQSQSHAYKLVKIDKSQVKEIKSELLLSRWSGLVDPIQVQATRRSQYPHIDRVLLARSKRLHGLKEISELPERQHSLSEVWSEVNQDRFVESPNKHASECCTAEEAVSSVTESNSHCEIHEASPPSPQISRAEGEEIKVASDRSTMVKEHGDQIQGHGDDDSYMPQEEATMAREVFVAFLRRTSALCEYEKLQHSSRMMQEVERLQFRRTRDRLMTILRELKATCLSRSRLRSCRHVIEVRQCVFRQRVTMNAWKLLTSSRKAWRSDLHGFQDKTRAAFLSSRLRLWRRHLTRHVCPPDRPPCHRCRETLSTVKS
mmetsp:Transcript_30487/g.98266  ORF Transcript_30487/g.98266 Transcript_30487/m.98266 type:complete len:384 (+) Transcript_30487:194-1345(+)